MTNEVFHAMHVILSLKLRDEGFDLFIHGWHLKMPVALFAILIPVCAFLNVQFPSTAESGPGLPGVCIAAASTTASHAAQNSMIMCESPCWFWIFCFISIISSVISNISKVVLILQLMSVFLFSLSLVG